METLREKQTIFARHVPRLIDKAFELGYLVGHCEWVRDPRIAQLNAQTGAGITQSLHCQGLAIDLTLYKPDGTYITDGTGHHELGEFWKSLHPMFCWGGDFTKIENGVHIPHPDFDHYSLTPDGVHK